MSSNFEKLKNQTFDEIFRCLSDEEPKKLPQNQGQGPFNVKIVIYKFLHRDNNAF